MNDMEKDVTDMSDAEFKQKALEEYQAKQSNSNNVTSTNKDTNTTSAIPTEIIDLPSKGKLYPKGHPLCSGKIEMRYMTAADEDILATDSYIRKGLVLDKLFESIIVTPINYRDLLTCDKDAIMIATRILSGYGKTYEAVVPGLDEKLPVDLTTLEDKPLHSVVESATGNEFEFTLPHCNMNITFKLLTHGDVMDIQEEQKLMDAKFKRLNNNRDPKSKDLTMRLKKMITSVDGETSNLAISKFVDGMLAGDSKALRDYVGEISPGIDYFVSYSDKNGEPQYEEFSIDIDFLYPGA